MTMQILLLGKSGQVGSALLPHLRALGNVVAPGRDAADLLQPSRLAALVDETRPRIIVNAAAYTAVDKAESERELAFRVNRDAPEALAQSAARQGALLIHYSTDYVFAGDRVTDAPGYREDDTTAPLCVYGESKLAGEAAVAAAGGAHVILRTAWVYAANGQNFVRTMRRLSHERETLRVVADQVGTPTWAGDIAAVTAAIARRHVGGVDEISGDHLGVFHLTSAGRTSWHGFAQAIIEAERERNGPVVTACIESIATSQYPTPARRPAFSVLDNGRLRAAYGIALEDWRARFQAFLAAESAPLK